MKYLLFAFFLLLKSLCMADLPCPYKFYISQDPKLRLFHVHDGINTIATVASSSYSVFDFYDRQNVKQWINHYDSLFDLKHERIALIEFHNDAIALYNEKRERVGILYEEETHPDLGKGLFVFRDAETNTPLAYATWDWSPPKTWLHSWLFVHEIDHQEWTVTVINRSRLEEKRINNLHLIWLLLKVSQCHLRGPRDLPYLDTTTKLVPSPSMRSISP